MKVLIFCLLMAFVSAGPKYCDKKYCERNTKYPVHIACNNNGRFACDKGYSIDLNPYIDDILKAHNEKRNLIAGGKLQNYKSATKMATMQWDNDLAELAKLNVMQCKMQHDCHNTDRFPTSGQNLAIKGVRPLTSTFIPIGPVLSQHIDSWWKENLVCNMNYINQYPTEKTISDKFGHFTAMARDSNTHVGCAAAKIPYFDEKGGLWDGYLLACNYAATNMQNQAIYESGKAHSACKSGTNKAYPNLCSPNEKYNKNN